MVFHGELAGTTSISPPSDLAGGDLAGAHAAARARLVVQHHRLAEEFTHLFDEGAQHVVGVARRERNHQLDRLDRKSVRRLDRSRGQREGADGRRDNMGKQLLDLHGDSRLRAPPQAP